MQKITSIFGAKIQIIRINGRFVHFFWSTLFSIPLFNLKCIFQGFSTQLCAIWFIAGGYSNRLLLSQASEAAVEAVCTKDSQQQKRDLLKDHLHFVYSALLSLYQKIKIESLLLSKCILLSESCQELYFAREALDYSRYVNFQAKHQYQKLPINCYVK